MPFTSTEMAARVEAAESRLIDAGAKALLLRQPAADLFVEPLAGGVASIPRGWRRWRSFRERP